MNFRVEEFIENQYEKDDYTYAIADDGSKVVVTDKNMNSMIIPMSIIYLIHKENEIDWIKEYYEDEIEDVLNDANNIGNEQIQSEIKDYMEILYNSALDDDDCMSFINNDLKDALNDKENEIKAEDEEELPFSAL